MLGGILFGSVLAIMTLAGVVAATVIEDRLLPSKPRVAAMPTEQSKQSEDPAPRDGWSPETPATPDGWPSEGPAIPDDTDR